MHGLAVHLLTLTLRCHHISIQTELLFRLFTCSKLSLLFLGMSSGMSCSAGGPVTAAPLDKFDCLDMICGDSASPLEQCCGRSGQRKQKVADGGNSANLNGEGAALVCDERRGVLPPEATEHLMRRDAGAEATARRAGTRPEGLSFRTVVDSSVPSLYTRSSWLAPATATAQHVTSATPICETAATAWGEPLR